MLLPKSVYRPLGEINTFYRLSPLQFIALILNLNVGNMNTHFGF